MGANGKAARTRQRILEVLRQDRANSPGRCMLIAEVARKGSLSEGGASRMLMRFWRAGRVLRRSEGRSKWAYRIVLEGEDIEQFKGAEFGLQAYDG